MKETLPTRFLKYGIRFQERLIAFLERGKEAVPEGREERLPLSGAAISLDELQGSEPESQVQFYDTENSEVARGAEKVIPKGLDKFGEKDTFDPDEADDHQTDRDRNQNSDLSKRFYTDGLDFDEINK